MTVRVKGDMISPSLTQVIVEQSGTSSRITERAGAIYDILRDTET